MTNKKQKTKNKKWALLVGMTTLLPIFLAACATVAPTPDETIQNPPEPDPVTPPSTPAPTPGDENGGGNGVFPELPEDSNKPRPDTSTYKKDIPSFFPWQMPNPGPKPETPNPAPTEPPASQTLPPREGVSNFTYTVNRELLKQMITTNEHGYSPKAMMLTLKAKQTAQGDSTWLKQFLMADEKSIVEWRDVTFFNFDVNEEAGTLTATFAVGSQKLSFTLNSDDGLLKSSDYYDHIKKLTLSLDVAYESIALNATGKDPVVDQSASQNNQGVMLKNGGYKTGARYSGTGWVMDRIQNANDETSETLSYIVGTNIHVGSFAGAFFEKINGVDVALDPLNIQFGWKRNTTNGANSGFNNTKANENARNEITNLRFGANNLFAEQFNTQAVPAIEDGNFDNIRSYYRPTQAMFNQKKQLMNSLIFSPKHQTSATVAGQTINYQSLGADFMAIRMNFKKIDLQQQWPELWEAFQNKTENQLFLKFNTTKALNEDENFYTGGYPGYRQGGEAWEQRIYRDEGYNVVRHGTGEFWKASTLSKLANQNLASPQFAHEEGLDSKAFGYTTKGTRVAGLPKVNDSELLQYIDRYNTDDFQMMWGKRNNVEGNHQGNQVSQALIASSAVSQISERELTANLRPMLRKIYTTAKRHLFGSSNYVKGGASGSMVINARKEIVGILSAVVPSYIQQGYKNAIFYDFYNTYAGMNGNKIYGLDILNKLREASINTTVMNPKKNS